MKNLKEIIEERIAFYERNMKREEEEMKKEMVGTNVKPSLAYEMAKSLYEEDIIIIAELEKILKMSEEEN